MYTGGPWMTEDELSKYFPWIPLDEKNKRHSILRWVKRRESLGLPTGCYGIYKWLVAQNDIRSIQKTFAEKRKNRFTATYKERRLYNNWRMWCYRVNTSVPFNEWAQCRTMCDRRQLLQKYANSPLKRRQKNSKERLKANLEKFKELGFIE
jgi:hypothetical protein